MATQHRTCPPNDCPTCRTVLDARASLFFANRAAGAPTNAAVTDRTGLSRRSVQFHSGHLTKYGFLDGGVPTGVPLDPKPPAEDPAPLEWASVIALPGACYLCRCILCELARDSRGRGEGQISMADLAGRLAQRGIKVSETTVRRHLRTGDRIRHISLEAAELVKFRPDSEVVGWDDRGRKRFVRRPDRYVLAPTYALKTVSPMGDDFFGDWLADRLRTETEWFDPTHDDALPIVRFMVSKIREDGMPVEYLMEKLKERPHRLPLKAPLRYVRARVPKIGERFARSSFADSPRAATRPQSAPDNRLRCSSSRCDTFLRAPTPDGVCEECRRDIASGFREGLAVLSTPDTGAP
ncbi:hypothetical protein [Streptomyces sp. NPDC087298]|uniref:hypothetical protein n=1 Tax=Streptomyces sp. NPDC087298 TaxID=3365779 RepID=UPI003806AA5C